MAALTPSNLENESIRFDINNFLRDNSVVSKYPFTQIAIIYQKQ